MYDGALLHGQSCVLSMIKGAVMDAVKGRHVGRLHDRIQQGIPQRDIQ